MYIYMYLKIVKGGYNMKLIKSSDCKTLEEYRAYLKQQSKLWYEKNRERKLQYQREYYYNSKNKEQEVI